MLQVLLNVESASVASTMNMFVCLYRRTALYNNRQSGGENEFIAPLCRK